MMEKYLNQFIEVKEIKTEEKEKNYEKIEKSINDEYDNSLLTLFNNFFNTLKIDNNEPNETNIRNSIIIILSNDILLVVSNEVVPEKFFLKNIIMNIMKQKLYLVISLMNLFTIH